jgi:hypothetical protein
MAERSDPPAADEEPDPGRPTVRIRPYLQAPPPAEDSAGRADGDGTDPVPAESAVPQGPRPFVLTSGRVAGADPVIGLETQVTACPDGGTRTGTPLSRLSPELQGIVALCGEPISVAEISARLRLHLGVTKVLIDDLRAAGHLDVHAGDIEDCSDPDLMRRVIDGLRGIS